jgi:hypothetical protein
MIREYCHVKGIAMGTQGGGSSSHSSDASVGVGPENDRRESEGSQRASGGSGGEQLTRSLEDTDSAAPSPPVERNGESEQEAPEGAGSAATAATRGPQDTHSKQAGSTPTGLGAPETGANQEPRDLAPQSENSRRPKK